MLLVWIENGNFEIISDETPEQDKNNRRALGEAIELQKKEVEEIGQLFSKVTTWWNWKIWKKLTD